MDSGFEEDGAIYRRKDVKHLVPEYVVVHEVLIGALKMGVCFSSSLAVGMARMVMDDRIPSKRGMFRVSQLLFPKSLMKMRQSQKEKRKKMEGILQMM